MERYTPDLVLDSNVATISLLKRSEGFVPKWYKDPIGVWTVGYGITERALPGVNRSTMPGPITEAQGTKLLIRALAGIYEPIVEHLVKVPLTPNMFGALTDFGYNVGERNFASSTLLRLLNRGDYKGAAAQFDRWVYAGGIRFRGLVIRRAAERALFEAADVRALVDLPNDKFVAILSRVTPAPTAVLQVHEAPAGMPGWWLRTESLASPLERAYPKAA